MVSKEPTEGNTCTLGATVVKIRHECIGGVLGFGKTVLYTRANEEISSKTVTWKRRKCCTRAMK